MHMTARHNKITYFSVRAAVRKTGLSQQTVLECMARELVMEPLTEADLVELRRIRRLRELGVDLPGIEIVLHMRRRIQALQAELEYREQLQRIWQRRLPWKPGG
jgi:hypothetical protein